MAHARARLTPFLSPASSSMVGMGLACLRVTRPLTLPACTLHAIFVESINAKSSASQVSAREDVPLTDATSVVGGDVQIIWCHCA